MSAGYKPRPQRPLVGPQARYTLSYNNIGLADSPASVVARFFETGWEWRSGLEFVLLHLDDFDEPSRHSILASTALQFDIPFDVLMGGLL